MRNALIKTALVAGAAIALLSGQANAQVQAPGFFGSLTGWYIVDGFNDWKSFRDSESVGVGDGWGGRAYAGYRFMGPWDVAIGGQYDRTSRGQTDSVNVSFLRHRMITIDGELGYNFAMNGAALRAFAGVRYLDARFYYDDTGTGRSNVDSWGVGPRIGLDGNYRFAGTAWNIFAGVSGSVLFGDIKERAIVNWSCNDCRRENRTAFGATAQFGVGYEIAPMVMLAAGYRIDANWGSNFDIHDGTGQGKGINSGQTIVHGPFARISYNIGSPTAAPVAKIDPPKTTNTYIVFFDFDRSNLTPTAVTTIRQAADAAKAGKSARVNVTGHADKSGGDQYNMALSLRRANTVKDELVRQGVPAASIVVVGRGESQPLVPTADGVKEPQNRRVEIVLQ